MKRLFIILFAAVLLTGCTDKQAEFEHQIELEDYLSDHAREYVALNYNPDEVYDDLFDYIRENYTPDEVFYEDVLLEYIYKHYTPEEVFPDLEEEYYDKFMDEYGEDIED